MKAALGLRRLLGAKLLGELQAGQAFNRILSIGSGLFTTDGGTANLNPDWYVSASVKARF
jgi:hypothetical protein